MQRKDEVKADEEGKEVVKEYGKTVTEEEKS